MLHLVDCSLLTPPQTGADGRSRYVMLETLRAYGAGLLADAGELDATAAALARYALRVAEEAAAGLQTSTAEVAAARRLDAEDAIMRQVLAWAMTNDTVMALRLAAAQGWWWFLRGRLPNEYPVLREAADVPRWAVTGGAPRSSGSAGQRFSLPTWPRRWVISPRSATPSRRGRRRGLWPMPWPAGRRHCSGLPSRSGRRRGL